MSDRLNVVPASCEGRESAGFRNRRRSHRSRACARVIVKYFRSPVTTPIRIFSATSERATVVSDVSARRATPRHRAGTRDQIQDSGEAALPADSSDSFSGVVAV